MTERDVPSLKYNWTLNSHYYVFLISRREPSTLKSILIRKCAAINLLHYPKDQNRRFDDIKYKTCKILKIYMTTPGENKYIYNYLKILTYKHCKRII